MQLICLALGEARNMLHLLANKDLLSGAILNWAIMAWGLFGLRGQSLTSTRTRKPNQYSSRMGQMQCQWPCPNRPPARVARGRHQQRPDRFWHSPYMPRHARYLPRHSVIFSVFDCLTRISSSISVAVEQYVPRFSQYKGSGSQTFGDQVPMLKSQDR